MTTKVGGQVGVQVGGQMEGEFVAAAGPLPDAPGPADLQLVGEAVAAFCSAAARSQEDALEASSGLVALLAIMSSDAGAAFGEDSLMPGPRTDPL